MKFLLDTNFLVAFSQFKVDVFTELEEFGVPELYTLDLVLKELKKISTSKGIKARHARFALVRMRKEGVKILITESKRTDSEIVRIAKLNSLVVCTQDRALVKRLKAKHVPVVTLRQKRYLVMK